MPDRAAPPPLRLLMASSLLLVLALGCAGGDATAPAPAAPVSTAPAAPTPAPAQAAQAAPATAALGSDGRPLYYDRALTEADVQGRTLRDFALLRNTIFARAGHPFVKPWLDSYFRAQPWYQPQAKADLTKLSDADHANVAFLTEAESRVSRDELVARRAAVAGSTSPDDAVELALISAALGEWSGAADVPMAERNPLEDPTVLANQLTVGQLDGLSRRDLRLLRNTIYARHGRPFKSDALQAYFFDKAWYQPVDSYDDGVLTAVDKRNIQLVQSMEDRLGGPMKEWEHQKEEGWFAGA